MSDHAERIKVLRSKFEELEQLVRSRLEPRAVARPIPEHPNPQTRVHEQGFRGFWARFFGGRE